MIRRVAFAWLLALAWGGCDRGKNASPAPATSPTPASTRTSEAPNPSDRRARAAAVFAHAALLKPLGDSVDADAQTYAPIIVHEVAPENSKTADGEADVQIAKLDAGTNGEPFVFVARSQADLFGEEYTQWVYRWSYATKDGDANDWRWLRITLDAEEFPQLWETLDPKADHVDVYVSQHVENLARAQYGEPLAGRTFAVERTAKGAPRAVVVRVLNDGPVPMGPLVYLDSDLTFSTVLCRCMDSQVRDIVTNEFYVVTPIARISDDAPTAETLFLPRAEFEARPWMIEVADPRFLEEVLRLPAGF